MSIVEFLMWLSGGVGATLVMSYIAERWEWFQSLSTEQKKLGKTFGATVIAIGAFLTFTYVPPEVWEMLTPYWQILLAVITANYGVEVFHFFDKRVARG
jgi:hypothetical protein